MIRKNKNTLGTVIILALLLTIASYMVNSLRQLDASIFVQPPSTPVIDSLANERFLKTALLDSSYELNVGLTVERMKILASEGGPTPPPNFISVLIQNHTQESMIFTDIGFGVQVFQFDAQSLKWSKVELPYVPEKTQKRLPPNTVVFDFNVLNSWQFNERDLVNVEFPIIRILVVGLGEDSYKKYGAYLDIGLQK